MKRLIILFWMFTFVAVAQTPDIAFSRMISNAASMTTNNFFAGPATNGNGLMLMRPMTNEDFWVRAFKNGTPGVVSNTTAETSLLDTNNILGRSQGIQPNEMRVGTAVKFHLFGFTTQTSGQNLQYKVKLGTTIILDTGSSSGFNLTSGAFEFYGGFTFFSSTQCRGWLDVKFEATGDKPASSGTLTGYSTIDNSVQQQLTFTVQSSSASTVHQVTTAIVEFY